MQKCTGKASKRTVASICANHPGAVYLMLCTCRLPPVHSAWSQGMNDELNAAKRVGGTLRRPSHGRSAFGTSWTLRDGRWQLHGQPFKHFPYTEALLPVASAGDVSVISGVSELLPVAACNGEV